MTPPRQVLEEAVDLIAVLGILLFAVFPLAVPGLVLLGIVVVPVAVIGLLAVVMGTILAPPYLVARSLWRRSRDSRLTP